MNKFIKEQLKRANIIIKYPDGNIVDLDNLTNCEFIIERVETKIKESLVNPSTLDTEIKGLSNTTLNTSTQPSKSKWPEIKIKRKNDNG